MVTSSIGAGRYRVSHSNGRHQFFADEPEEKGGKDTAPTPDELLEAALASCTLITVRMYTDHKQWAVGQISISVSLQREEGKSTITRVMKFEQQITEEQKKRLVQVAKACPVSKTISGNTELIVEIS